MVTLGRYATGLLRGEMTPLGAVRGRAEIRVLGSRAVRLFPVLHPAAALYRREPNLRLLQEDFARIPALWRRGRRSSPRGKSRLSRPTHLRLKRSKNQRLARGRISLGSSDRGRTARLR